MLKSKIAKPKYIAEGFHEDAVELLQEFIGMSTTEFLTFTEIWKKHHFSLIFMGRPDHIENTEFTNEIFKITTQFLSSASFYERVGAVFLLYALFRNQISVPPIKIRIEINQWRIIKTLHIEAKLKKYNTLHYVIDYLVKNAFMYVARQMLRGPLTGIQNESKNCDALVNIKSTYKSDIMEYSVSNNLQALRDLHLQYFKEKKTFCDDVKINLTRSSDTYEEFLHELKTLVDPGPSKSKKDTVGSRRAKIKAQSFIRKTHDRYGNDGEQIDNERDLVAKLNASKKRNNKKKHCRTKRVPEQYRRVGRPKKKSKKPEPEVPEEPQSDDEIDFTHLLSQQQEFYLPPAENEQKKIRTRRDPYYKASPKRDELSDPDDLPADLYLQ